MKSSTVISLSIIIALWSSYASKVNANEDADLDFLPPTTLDAESSREEKTLGAMPEATHSFKFTY